MKSFKEFLNENKEPLYEMSKAFGLDKPRSTVWVENPNNWNNKYFKLYNNTSILKATKVARISMLNPIYLEHVDELGKEDWKLQKRDIKKLAKELDDPSSYDNITKWELLIMTYNNDNFNIDPADLQTGKMTKDEYEKIVKKKGAISLKLPRPKYEDYLWQ